VDLDHDDIAPGVQLNDADGIHDAVGADFVEAAVADVHSGPDARLQHKGFAPEVGQPCQRAWKQTENIPRDSAAAPMRMRNATGTQPRPHCNPPDFPAEN
jgi:hypothetical protein